MTPRSQSRIFFTPGLVSWDFFFRNAKIVDKQGDPLSNYTTRDKNDQKFLLEKKEKSEIFKFRERKKNSAERNFKFQRNFFSPK